MLNLVDSICEMNKLKQSLIFKSFIPYFRFETKLQKLVWRHQGKLCGNTLSTKVLIIYILFWLCHLLVIPSKIVAETSLGWSITLVLIGLCHGPDRHYLLLLQDFWKRYENTLAFPMNLILKAICEKEFVSAPV